MAKRTYKVSGKTDDGKTVVGNVGYMCFSRGMSLEMLLEIFKLRDLVVDWADYIEEAKKDGHNPQTVLSKIGAAVGEVYGPKYRDEVIKRAELYYGI